MRGRLSPTGLLLAAALLSLWPASSSALVMEALTNQQLTTRSEAVVHGVVLGHATRRLEGRGLWTDYQVRVVETLKGAAASGDVLTVGLFGGTLEGRTQVIPGDASLRDGEEVVLFLNRSRDAFVLTAFSQAKFHVELDPVLGVPTVTRDFGGSDFVSRGAKAPEAAPMKSARLDDFRAEILDAAKSPAPTDLAVHPLSHDR